MRPVQTRNCDRSDALVERIAELEMLFGRVPNKHSYSVSGEVDWTAVNGVAMEN